MAYTKPHKLHIVCVTMVIANPKGKFLIVKRSLRETAYPGKWAIPGGKVEYNDTVMKTLKDEAEEELGIEIEDRKIYLNDRSFIRPDDQTVKLFVYLAFAKSFDIELDKNDFDDYKWVSPDELDSLNCVSDLKNELQLAQKCLDNYQVKLYDFRN